MFIYTFRFFCVHFHVCIHLIIIQLSSCDIGLDSGFSFVERVVLHLLSFVAALTDSRWGGCKVDSDHTGWFPADCVCEIRRPYQVVKAHRAINDDLQLDLQVADGRAMLGPKLINETNDAGE